MRAAKTKAGGGSGIHRLAAAKAKGTIRPNPKGKEEHGEVHSGRGMEYGTHVQPTRMEGFEPKKPLGRKRGGRADGGKWIQKAVSPAHEGMEKRAAKRAGESTHAYMEKHEHDSGKAGDRARLGLRLSAMAKHKS